MTTAGAATNGALYAIGATIEGFGLAAVMATATSRTAICRCVENERAIYVSDADAVFVERL